jgi:hypothetical protein
MLRLIAATLIFAAFGVADGNGAPARPAGTVHAQGFYRVHHFYGGFYRQYPYTLFGYPNYNWSYYPLYEEYPSCDFVWGKRTGKSKAAQHGTWTCS